MIESEITVDCKPVFYIPSLTFNHLTTYYDWLMKWIGRERAFKPELIKQASIRENSRVLDLGCGTATLTILAKKNQPKAEVTGIDIDPKALKIAAKKATRERVEVAFELGAAFKLLHPDNYFDKVISSLVFHHIATEDKIRTLKEVLRVLKPEGELHVADLDRPQNILMHLPSLFMRHIEEAKDNVKGLLPQMFETAGFEQVEETKRVMTVVGTVALHSARKPAEI